MKTPQIPHISLHMMNWIENSKHYFKNSLMKDLCVTQQKWIVHMAHMDCSHGSLQHPPVVTPRTTLYLFLDLILMLFQWSHQPVSSHQSFVLKIKIKLFLCLILFLDVWNFYSPDKENESWSWILSSCSSSWSSLISCWRILVLGTEHKWTKK